MGLTNSYLNIFQHEEAVKAMKFPYTSIFRPGLLDRPAASRRFGEKLASKHYCVVGLCSEVLASQDQCTYWYCVSSKRITYLKVHVSMAGLTSQTHFCKVKEGIACHVLLCCTVQSNRIAVFCHMAQYILLSNYASWGSCTLHNRRVKSGYIIKLIAFQWATDLYTVHRLFLFLEREMESGE